LHLGVALAGVVAREASRHRSWWRRVLLPLPNAMLDASERMRTAMSIAAFSLVGAGLLLAYPTHQRHCQGYPHHRFRVLKRPDEHPGKRSIPQADALDFGPEAV
jgi:hypothetical protein